MTGAMYAAISGLKSHMNKLNVIGNNIANVNTYGYKAGRTVFETSLYTMMNAGSNGTSTVGGRNPSQIGYGTTIGSVDIDMSTGNYSPTGKATDCMIDGDGFFLLGDKSVAGVIDPADPSTLKALTLSRVGNFEFKADGYLSDGNGNTVYGFMTIGMDDTGKPIVSDQLVPIRFPKIAQEEVTVNGVTTTQYVVKYAVEDAAGGGGGKGALRDANAGDVAGAAGGAQDELPFAEFDSISIDGSTGKITGIVKNTDQVITIGFIAIGNVTNPNGVTQMSGSYYKANEGAGNLTVSLLGGAGDDLRTDLNDATKMLTHVNAGTVADQTTLPDLMRVNSGGTTQLITGGLEMSKTDLATEISEMITTQRGYQANTRIITVTDSMLEELVNMKR